MTIIKTLFERAYRVEQDVIVKERMLLLLNALFHGMIVAIWPETFIEVKHRPVYDYCQTGSTCPKYYSSFAEFMKSISCYFRTRDSILI